MVILALTILILLPVAAYLLQPLSSHKAIVFLTSIFLFGGFALNFMSDKAILGSWSLAQQSDAISKIIYTNTEFPENLIIAFTSKQSSSKDQFLSATEIFYQALELNSFSSAESILKIINARFTTQNFKIPIYNLLANLRDSKYPIISDAKILLFIEDPLECLLERLKVMINIPNGPEVNIADKLFIKPDFTSALFLDKSDAFVKGFDLPSAFLNQEIIKIEAVGSCANKSFYVNKVLDLQYSQDNQDEVYIYPNEWLKKEQ